MSLNLSYNIEDMNAAGGWCRKHGLPHLLDIVKLLIFWFIVHTGLLVTPWSVCSSVP